MKRKSASTENKNKPSFDILPAAVIFIILLLWQLIVMVYKIPKYILPAPLMVLEALIEERELLWSHTLVTLGEALIGFVLAVFLGIISGILMGFFETIRRALYPIFVISQTIPTIVLAPLFAVWFGFGLMPKVLIVILVCFFPIAVTFTQGLVKTEESMEQLLKVMGASKWKTFCVVRVPQAIPSLFSGLKIAATYSIMGAVLSEWVGAKMGLGILMTRAMSSFRTALLFADILVIVILSLGVYKVIEFLEKKAVGKINNS